MRYRNSENFISMAVDASTVIEPGDMLFLDTDDVKPASSFTWNTDLATTQAAFKDQFVGIAMEAHPSGVAGNILVMTKGVFEMECPSTTWQPGALVGPDKASGNALLSQTVETAVAASACGIVHDVGTKTRVKVYFVSQKLLGIKAGE
jgi:hypothetical protein